MSIVPYTMNSVAQPTHTFMPEPVSLNFSLYRGGTAETFLGSKKITPLKQILEKVMRGFSWNGTALGKVVSLFKDYCDCPSEKVIERMRPYLSQARREAKYLLCAAGALGSAAVQNPLPLLLMLPNCITFAEAAPTVAHPIPDYQTQGWGGVNNYQFAEDTFHDPEDTALVYSALLAKNNGSLPKGLDFDASTRTFSGGVDNSLHIRVFAKNYLNETAFSDFEIKVNIVAVAIFLTIFGGALAAICIYGIVRCYKINKNKPQHNRPEYLSLNS